MESDVLNETRRRCLYYKIHHAIKQLSRWSKAVYRPLHPADRQSLLAFAKSVIEFTIRIQNMANDLLSILQEKEKENN